MAGEPVVNNKVLIRKGEVMTDLRKQRWIVGASLGVDGSRDIYAVARCDNNEPEYYSAVMIFKPYGTDPLTVEMQAHVCNPKTIEKWKKSKGIRHLAVTPILGTGNYKYNNEMHSYVITHRYGKNLQELLASNDKGFIAPTIYKVIGQMFYALEYVHSLGYYIKFDISSDKLLQSFTNPNDIYLDVIDYVKTQEYLAYRSGKFPVESPYGNLESVLYNSFNWLKLPLPWQNDLIDETLVIKKKKRAFTHVETFLRCVFGNFGVLNPIRHIMFELASSDVTKEPDYKKFLSIVAEGARNIKNVQYNLDSSLNFDEELKLRQINKLSRQPIPSFSEDSSDEKDSKGFKKMIDAKGNAENSTKAAADAENNTSNPAAINSTATPRSPSPILSLGKRNAKTAPNVTTPSAATTSTARLEPSKMTEPSKTTVNEVTQNEKPKETESQNEQQRTIPKSVSEVGASTSSNVQPEKNITASDAISSCKCKAGVVNDRVNEDSSRRPTNTVQSSDGSESHKKENKIGNCDVKTEVIDVSSGDEVSTVDKPNLKVEKPEKKFKKESSEKNKNAEKEKRKKSRDESSSSEDSDSSSREKSLKKKKKKKKSLLKKKRKEKKSGDSSSSDSDDSSSNSNDDGKSKSKKKKRKKHRSASSDSGGTTPNSKIKKGKRKNSKKTIKNSESDASPTRDSNKKESKNKRSPKRREDRDSDMNSSRDSIRIDPRSRTSFKRRQHSDSDLNSPRRSSRRDSRSRTSPKRRKDSDHDRSSENKNESSSRNRQRSPSKYSEQRFSRPNSYSTKAHNNNSFGDSRYQSDSGSFRQKPFHNFKNYAYDRSSFSYDQASKNIHSHFHNTNHRQHYDPPRNSYQQHYVRGNNHYPRSRPPYIRGRSSHSRNDRVFLNNHETQPGKRWNFYPRSDGRSTSPASTSSNLIEQKQAHNEKYSHEEAQLRNVNQDENGSGEVSTARDYRRRDFKHCPTDDRERHDRIEKLHRAEGRDDLLKKGLPPEVNKPAARDTDDSFERELRTVEQEDPMLVYAKEDEVNVD